MRTPQLVLARRVAHLERAAMGVDDAPWLRVLWWQCVAEMLQVHMAQERDGGDTDGESRAAAQVIDTEVTANSDEWRIELSPITALRYSQAGVVLEPQARELRAHTPMATRLRLRQKSWAQELRLWLVIEGEGWVSAAQQVAIDERFKAAGRQAPQLRHVKAVIGERATWRATWQWEESLWVSRGMVVAEVRRWAQDTAMAAAEHWLLMCGMVELAAKSLEPGAKLVTIDVKMEASNEKKF